MTRIIVEGRRAGKTTKAIIQSVKTGGTILVAHKGMARAVEDAAEKMGIQIPKDMPKPITIREFEHKRENNLVEDGVIIDEALIVLREVLGVPIEMITMSDKEQEGPSVNLKINNIQEYNQKLDVIAGRAKMIGEAIDDINNTKLDISVD